MVALSSTLESIMKSPIQGVGADTPVVDALLMCESRGIHHMPLFDGTTLLGIVCMCDLEEVALDAPVRRAVHHAPVVFDVAEPISSAVASMNHAVVASVLVTRGGDPVGIVTREDALAAANDDDSHFDCEVCRGRTHVKHGTRGLLCVDCRNRATPADVDDELGGSE